MIKICDHKAKLAREQNASNPIPTNIKHYGSYAIKRYGRIHCKAVKEIIRITDAEIEEYNYTKEKYENEIDFINLKAREAFENGINTVTLKCCYGFNAIGIRDNKINEGTMVVDCPRYGESKTWKHIILCNENHYRRAELIYELETKLPQIKEKFIPRVCSESIDWYRLQHQ